MEFLWSCTLTIRSLRRREIVMASRGSLSESHIEAYNSLINNSSNLHQGKERLRAPICYAKQTKISVAFDIDQNHPI